MLRGRGVLRSESLPSNTQNVDLLILSMGASGQSQVSGC